MVLGGGYLAYLGVLMLRVRENVVFDENKIEQLNQATTIGKRNYKGLLVNLSNAKTLSISAASVSLFWWI